MKVEINKKNKQNFLLLPQRNN